MNRPLSQWNSDFATEADAPRSSFCEKHNSSPSVRLLRPFTLCLWGCAAASTARLALAVIEATEWTARAAAAAAFAADRGWAAGRGGNAVLRAKGNRHTATLTRVVECEALLSGLPGGGEMATTPFFVKDSREKMALSGIR